MYWHVGTLFVDINDLIDPCSSQYNNVGMIGHAHPTARQITSSLECHCYKYRIKFIISKNKLT
jgi:hypothetical protein